MSLEQNETIPEGTLLDIANNILDLLDYSSELESEDDLFLDDFYVCIVSNLVSDRKFTIKPGKTKKEKVKRLNELIQFLSQIIEMDFSQISARGIIEDHDRASTKCLLELIEELIKALIEQGQGEEDHSEPHSAKVDSFDEEKKKGNISDDVMVNNRKKEIEFEDKEISKNSEIDIMNKNISNENIQHSEDINIVDDETNKDIHISSPNNNEDSNNINIDHIDNINESNDTPNILNKSEHPSTSLNKSEHQSLNHSDDDYYGNRSCLEPLDIEKIMKMGQDASYIRHTMTENDISRYAREYAEMEEQEEDEKYTPMDVLEVNDNNNLQETPIKNESYQ